MDRREYAESLREHAKLTWELAEKARNEGNVDLADELHEMAAHTEMRAMSTWPVNLSRDDEGMPIGAEPSAVANPPAELKPIPLRKKQDGADAR